MTMVARVRRAELHRKIRPRNADAVVAALVNDHIGPRRHVACDALGSRRSDFMKMMLRRIVTLSQMALETNLVAVRPQRKRVRIMAVTTSHSRMKHPALDERAILVDLTLDLAVWEIEGVRQQCYPIIVAHRLTMDVVFMNLAAARVTSSAHL